MISHCAMVGAHTMMLPLRSSLAFALICSGCAITALVGENPDAGFALDAVAAPMDQASPSDDRALVGFDAPAASEVSAPHDAGEVSDAGDVRELPDRLAPDRDAAVVQITDAPLFEAGSGDATTAAIQSPADGSGGDDDARAVLSDVGARACRRDAECVGDPAGPFCSLLTNRCAQSR